MTVKPYKNAHGSKKEQVEQMFDNISGKYDFLNHLLSLNLDKIWRKKAVGFLKDKAVDSVLDVATGTGDMIIPISRLNPRSIIGVDLSEGMLSVASRKFKDKYPDIAIEFIKGDSEKLPFEDHSFDVATVAFGVRNFENTIDGLMEIRRVLKPGGCMVVLEFSKPVTSPFRNLYHFYFRHILPMVGRIFSRDQEAYTYLPESVNAFPERNQFTEMMQKSGFTDCRWKSLTWGVATIYTGNR